MEKVILYYKFTPISDPLTMKLWQKTLCEKLDLHGRILVSSHGINGTVGGDIRKIKDYIKAVKEFPGFADIVFKWSEGGKNNFPRLSVKVKKEIVAFGAPNEVHVDESGIIGGGKHLTPKQVHELVNSRGDDVVFFDGRNAYEAQIGKFANAIVPDTHTSRDFIRELDSGKYDAIKDKPIITYCTGGVRCEILSSLMINRGFTDVYQIDGGIVKYGEEFKDHGLWQGSLYVFDSRMTMKFSEQAQTIGTCCRCAQPTDNFENCAWSFCHELRFFAVLCGWV